jgi:hypothetical protein
MKKILAGLLFLFIPFSLYPLENDLLNINVPTGMETNKFAFIIQHRFYGDVTDDPIGNHFGIDYGANVCLRMRYRAWNTLELKAGYTRDHKEYTLGSSYAIEFHPLYLRSQIDIEFFDYTDFGIDEKVKDFFYMFSLQSDTWPNHLSVLANLGYDGENSKIGMGIGVDLGFDIQFKYIQRIHLIAEYYPLRDKENYQYRSFSFGLKAETFGHLFMFSLGNNTEIGTRRAMLGTYSNTLHLGFNIYRFL